MNRKYTNNLILQNGGALVESILICGVLVIFMIGIPMMGTVVDVKQKTIQASRYSAWEKTVENSAAPEPTQVDARFFRSESAPIRSIQPGEELLGHNHLWGELQLTEEQANSAEDTQSTNNEETVPTVSRDNLQLYQRARVTADVKNVDVTTPIVTDDSLVYTKVGGVVSKVGRFLSEDGWDPHNPEVNGLIRSEVKINIENNTFLSNNANIAESTAILTDGWSAADANIIRERVHGFVPTNRLEKVGEIVSKVKIIPMLKDLGNLEKAFGCVKLGVRPSKKMDGSLPKYEPGPEGDESC